MRTRVILASGLFLLLLVPVADGQVWRCEKDSGKAFSDDWLKSAVEALKLKVPDSDLQVGEPCARARSTRAALARTLRRDYLKSAAGFEYTKIINGDGYFTLERFKIPESKDRTRLETALKKCQHCKLAIEENTCLDHFFVDDSVVFMISSAAGCRDNSENFRRVEQSMRSLAKSQAQP